MGPPPLKVLQKARSIVQTAPVLTEALQNYWQRSAHETLLAPRLKAYVEKLEKGGPSLNDLINMVANFDELVKNMRPGSTDGLIALSVYCVLTGACWGARHGHVAAKTFRPSAAVCHDDGLRTAGGALCAPPLYQG
jgi:hypothetical protein